jgi:signal transduction histidine kinase
MRELDALGRTAARLAQGDLDARVGAVGSGEVAHLARTIDYMADRVQMAFTRERELEAGRRQLLAAVSHDLRTPLATTRAMVEAITEGVLSEPDEVRHYLTVIRGEIQHLSRLIDDLFELSQIESGSLELLRTPTSLAELVSETLAAYETRARERSVTLEQRVEAHLPPILADPAQLQRVLRFLIENALRSASTGGYVRVEARADGPDARLSVNDTGPGLGQDELERAFDPFYRGEPARSRGSGPAERSAGTGLSLALARGLVQLHGGRIWAERSAGDGAVFVCTIPFATE